MGFDIGARFKKKVKRPRPESARSITGRQEGTVFELVGTADVLFDGAEMRNVQFSRQRFSRFTVVGKSRFVNCDFSGCSFQQSLFSHTPQVVYEDCRFDGARFGVIDPGQARFERCSFEETRIKEWFCTVAEFVGCSFGGRIEGTVFFGRPFGPGAESLDPRREINEFSGNDFRKCELIDTAFRMGVDLRQQQLPQGDEYIFVDRLGERTAIVQEEVANWDDPKARDLALALLKGLAEDAAGGQEQLFAMRDDPFLRAVPKRIRYEVWSRLEEAVLA